ncbi:NAD(P)/FAD-dependent oxidoreductase [Rhodococcus koreensis]
MSDHADPVGTIAVVGASLAGLHATEALLECPKVESVTVIGEEAGAPYDRPPLSKELLQGTWEPEKCFLAGPPGDPRVIWRTGARAVGLDPVERRLDLADGTSHVFDGGIVIATGGTPRTLPGAELPGVHVLRTLDDAIGLRDDLSRAEDLRVVVVGGGFIGAEVAAACLVRGHRVTMLEAAAAPFERTLGVEVGAAVVAPLLTRGVQLVTDAIAVAIAGADRAEAVTLRDGTSVPADVVVLGLGIEPGTAWLAGSGLHLDGGLHCDTTLAVSDRIVAAGDVAKWPNSRFGEFRRVEHWDNAVRQGRHAAQRLLADHGYGEARDFVSVPWVWSDQNENKLQIVGTTVGHDGVLVAHGTLPALRFVALYRRGDELTAAFGMNQPKLVMKYRRLLSRRIPWDEAVAALGVVPGATP